MCEDMRISDLKKEMNESPFFVGSINKLKDNVDLYHKALE